VNNFLKRVLETSTACKTTEEVTFFVKVLFSHHFLKLASNFLEISPMFIEYGSFPLVAYAKSGPPSIAGGRSDRNSNKDTVKAGWWWQRVWII
jgi:hypothetical protein